MTMRNFINFLLITVFTALTVIFFSSCEDNYLPDGSELLDSNQLKLFNQFAGTDYVLEDSIPIDSAFYYAELYNIDGDTNDIMGTWFNAGELYMDSTVVTYDTLGNVIDSLTLVRDKLIPTVYNCDQYEESLYYNSMGHYVPNKSDVEYTYTLEPNTKLPYMSLYDNINDKNYYGYFYKNDDLFCTFDYLEDFIAFLKGEFPYIQPNWEGVMAPAYMKENVSFESNKMYKTHTQILTSEDGLTKSYLHYVRVFDKK